MLYTFFKLPPVVVTNRLLSVLLSHLKCFKYHCALDGSM